MAKQLLSGKLTSKGQLTIPVELRTILNIKEGDRLAFVLDENERIIEVQPKTKIPSRCHRSIKTYCTQWRYK